MNGLVQSPMAKVQSCVAQAGSLLYRRAVLCRALDFSNEIRHDHAQPTASRQYSRAPLCATAEGGLL